MNFLANWSPKQIEYMKKEVAEYYANDNKLMPNDFKKFFVSTKFNDIDMLKDAVISISGNKDYMNNLVQDICFTIEKEYQSFYKLDENNWNKVA